MSKASEITRRQLAPLGLGAGAAAAALWRPDAALAAAYPARTVNFIVPDSGGGTFDAYVREFSRLLHNRFAPATFEPVTAPGAGGQAAVLRLLTSPPDGYTMGTVNVPGILASQYRKNGAKLPLDSLTWIANLGREPYAFAVSAKSPIKTVADLKKLGKQRPVLFSSTGFGSTDYFATRVFASALQINYKQILGYTGSAPTVVAVARGEVDGVVHSTSGLKKLEEAGLIKIIFSFQPDANRKIDHSASIGLPELSEIYQWRPIAAPPRVASDIVAKLSDALVAAAKTPEAAAWAKTAGTTLYPLGSAATLAMIKSQEAFVAKWARYLA